MPVLFVTRRLPASIEALAAQKFDARLTPSDVPIPDLSHFNQLLSCPASEGPVSVYFA